MKLNKILLRYSITAFVLCFVILCSVIFSSSVGALTVKENSDGLTISPLRSEMNIAPGTSLSGVLKITNSTNKVMVVDLNADEFSIVNQQYDYAFSKESGISKWVTFSSQQINLSIGETREISYIIGVPLSAEPGGRYISLFASTGVKSKTGDTNSIQRVASLLYITVTGDVSRSGRLVSLSSPWAFGGESKWAMSVQNTGTTHFHSLYSVSIQSIFDKKSIASLSGNSLILPDTIRTLSNDIPVPQLPGIYRIIFTIGLGDSPASIQTRYILYLPLISALIITIIIISVITLFYYRYLRKKSN